MVSQSRVVPGEVDRRRRRRQGRGAAWTLTTTASAQRTLPPRTSASHGGSSSPERRPQARRSALERRVRWAARKAPATPKSHTNNDEPRVRGLVLTKGKIHTMDGSNRVVEEVADRERPLPRGRQPRRPAPEVQGDQPQGQDGRPRPDRGPRARRQPRQPARLPHRDRAGDEHRRHPGSCSPRGGRTSRRASSSPRWAAGARTSSPSGACRRSPSSMPRSPTGRSSSTRGGGGPAVTNSLGKAFFESVSDAQAGPVVVSATGAIATGNPNQANRALYHLRVRQTFEDKKRSAIDAMKYSASVGLTAHLDQVLPPATTPLSPTQGLPNLDHFRMYDAWLAVHGDGDSHRPAADELPAQPERHRAAGAEGAAEEPVPALRRRHDDDRRDRRVGRAGRRRRPASGWRRSA